MQRLSGGVIFGHLLSNQPGVSNRLTKIIADLPVKPTKQQPSLSLPSGSAEKVQNSFMDVRQVALVALTAGFLFSAAPCPAQSMRPADLAQGKILITHRDSPDPLFAHSVIVLARYDQTGALGLMIHYRSNLTIQNALAGIKGAEKRTDPLFVGGPVELPVVLALLRSDSPPEGAKQVAGNLYLMSSKQSIGAALSEGRKASELRIFIGYSGWGPAQLDREVLLNGWYIFNFNESLVFDEHPETLWKRLIEKTELQRALFWQPR
jgi:putative transcriptional regulator